jgi:hypothetical protein
MPVRYRWRGMLVSKTSALLLIEFESLHRCQNIQYLLIGKQAKRTHVRLLEFIILRGREVVSRLAHNQ